MLHLAALWHCIKALIKLHASVLINCLLSCDGLMQTFRVTPEIQRIGRDWHKHGIIESEKRIELGKSFGSSPRVLAEDTDQPKGTFPPPSLSFISRPIFFFLAFFFLFFLVSYFALFRGKLENRLLHSAMPSPRKKKSVQVMKSVTKR